MNEKHINKNSKELESRCLSILAEISDFPEISYELIDSERPDFLSKEKNYENKSKIGIEHFTVDLFSDEKGSKSRIQNSTISKKVEEYQNNPSLLNEDSKNGKSLKWIEDNFNYFMNMPNNFEYKQFKNNFKRVFYKHYNKIKDYKKECEKIGFLIEISYIEPLANTGFLVDKNSNGTQSKIPPLTKDIIKCFKNKKDLDFVIILYVPYLFTGNPEEYKKCKAIKFESRHTTRNVKEQNINLYTDFCFVPLPKIETKFNIQE